MAQQLSTSGKTSVGTILQSDDAGVFAAVVTKQVAEAAGGYGALKSAGTSVLLEGELVESPAHKQQKVELKVSRVLYLGTCDNSAGKYPLPKTRQEIPPEVLRACMHLRPRTALMRAILRIRHALAMATHDFFQSDGFLLIHTPVITTSDCEGAGEQFQVTTLLSKAGQKEEEGPAQQLAIDETRAGAAEEGADKALKHAAKAEAEKLKQSEAAPDAHQSEAEQQAEHSNTTRHLAEFVMVEPEMAFSDLEDDMRCAEAYVQHCCRHVLDKCLPDLEFLSSQKTGVDCGALARLQQIAESSFARCSYTEAISILQDHVKTKRVEFVIPVEWGMDLASEHERYLAETVFKRPVIVFDYPKGIKAFYMRANDDGKTVAAMDVLVPKVGELIGGSQREERLEVLEARMKELGMPPEQYSAYLDLRRYGTVPHSGFGLGFERLVMLVTGVENIREVIPFPRWPGHADF
ncbi:Asparagine-tRNA ligase [Coccomyxa sp. Obi]|nr:Asparagine-tRNA ligase [Coccomyxa sp. Obi]